MWMRNECERLFFVTQKSGVDFFVGGETWWMHKVEAYYKIDWSKSEVLPKRNMEIAGSELALENQGCILFHFLLMVLISFPSLFAL